MQTYNYSLPDIPIHQDDLEPWHVLLIWIAADLVFTIVAALPARFLVDKNGNGVIDVNELPRLTDTNTRPEAIKLRGGLLYELGLTQVVEMLVETFFLCSSYGYFVAFAANWAYADSMDPRLSYLVTIYLVFLSLVFLFAFSLNGVHVITSHLMHTAFYAFGFLPMLLFRVNPGWELLVGGVLAKLCWFFLYRTYVWPHYPTLSRIVPLYKKRVVDHVEEVELVSTPYSSDVKKYNGYCPILFHWISFPIYEILNMHVASSFAYGALVGWMTAGIGKEVLGYSNEACFAGAFGTSAVASVVYICLRRGYFEQKWKTLSVFRPRLLSVYSFLIGGGCVSVHYLYLYSDVDTITVYDVDYAIVAIGHGLHVISAIFLFAFPYFAAGYHYGFVPVLSRCCSCRGGNGGLQFTGERAPTVLSLARAAV